MAVVIGNEQMTEVPKVNPLQFVSFGAGPAAKSSIAALVTRGLTREVPDPMRDGRLYASDAGLCERKAVLGAIQTGTQVDTAASRGYYALGNSIEDLVMDGLYQSNALLFKQYKLPDVGLNLGGYIDGVILVGGRIRVLEVKSCGKLPDYPKPNHAAQAFIYSAITGLPASLIYLSRTVAKFDGTLLIKEFNLEENQEEKRKALYRAVFASMAVQMKRIPEKPVHMLAEGDCSAAFCQFTHVCWHGSPAPSSWPVATPLESLQMAKLAQTKVDELLAPQAVISRRTGVLKHLQLHGNELAKKTLAGDWSSLI